MSHSPINWLDRAVWRFGQHGFAVERSTLVLNHAVYTSFASPLFFYLLSDHDICLVTIPRRIANTDTYAEHDNEGHEKRKLFIAHGLSPLVVVEIGFAPSGLRVLRQETIHILGGHRRDGIPFPSRL
jgi:hypothetical protein